jgi:putative ABC transport system permease protein
MYIQSELSYDSFHKNKHSIYRLGFEFFNAGKSLGRSPKFTPPFGPGAQSEFPEVKSFCRISEGHESILASEKLKIKSSNIVYADSSFFTMFSYGLPSGNPATVLKQPYSIVLTTSLAHELFGNVSAVGKVIRLDGKDYYTVTGIANAAPDNSQISYDALISFSTLYRDTLNYIMDWNGGNQYITYLQLNNAAAAGALEKKFTAFMWENINSLYAKRGIRIDASLQPLTDVHLKYEDDSENTRTNLYVFAIVAMLILIISSVNYINLTTAQASARFKEIGVRKYLGASRKQLIIQFLGESLLLTFFTFILSIIIVYAVAPIYAQLLGKPLLASSVGMVFFLFPALAVILFIGLGAGSYLAFYLSSLNVYQTLKSANLKRKHAGFRKALIIGQFAITIGLMTCTLIVNFQLRYTKNKSLGFDKDHIIALTLTGDKTRDAASVLKQNISALADVDIVSAVSQIPHDGISVNGFVPEGYNDAMMVHQLDADEDMLKTLRLKMVSGEYFSKNIPSDADGYIINETLAKMLGWEKPLGKTIARDGKHKVVGVVQDFIFSSLHENIGPLIITNHPWQNRFGYLAIRYKSNNPSVLLGKLKNIWGSLAVDAPFDYWFLDEAYDNLYKSEQRFQTLFFYFSILSILLSLAGIFGLVALTIQSRTKEIGIRKVLGAGILDITKVTTGDFLTLIIIASLIAIPVSWYYMNIWLQNFAFRITLNWWMFIIAGTATLMIALITICTQTFIAAKSNPVIALRME